MSSYFPDFLGDFDSMPACNTAFWLQAPRFPEAVHSLMKCTLRAEILFRFHTSTWPKLPLATLKYQVIQYRRDLFISPVQLYRSHIYLLKFSPHETASVNLTHL